MKKILRYFFSTGLLILFTINISAQTQRIKGLRLGVDLSRFSLYYLQPEREGYEFSADFEIHVIEVFDEKIEFDGYWIRPFPVSHGVPAIGYIFGVNDSRGKFNKKLCDELGIKGEMFALLEKNGKIEVNGREISIDEVTGKTKKGKKIVYTGDTEKLEVFPEEAYHCDVLIHESTFISQEDKKETYHSTVKEACEVSQLLSAKKLILTHISQRYETKEVIEESKKYCENAIVAEDFLEINL